MACGSIGAALFAVSQERSSAVDFTVQVRDGDNTFFIKNQNAAFTWTSFLKPFNNTSRCTLIIMILICAISLFITAHLVKEKNISEFSLQKSLIYSFGAYCAIAARRLELLHNPNW